MTHSNVAARRSAVLIAAGVGAVLLAGPAHAECQNVGAVGTGINEGTAKFMADAGLKNIIDAKGMRREGAVSYKCEAGVVLTECHARQKPCK